MPRIGILCDQDRKREEMIQIVEMLAAKEGFDCIIYALGREADSGCGDTACVILALEDREAAFRCAEKLWRGEPALLIIYVAERVEDIIAALTMMGRPTRVGGHNLVFRFFTFSVLFFLLFVLLFIL